jgi:hypothetical protein
MDPILESALRTARVRVPSGRLDDRMRAVFADAESSRRQRMWLGPLAIAAGLAIVAAPAFWVWRSSGHVPGVVRITAASQPAETAAAPLRLQRDVSQVFDDGVVAVSDNTPYRQIRRRTISDIWFIDPQTHARLLVRVPSEEISVQKAEAF